MSYAKHGHMHKDQFLPTDRETINAKIIRQSKANKGPDPGTYKDFPKPKIIGLAKQKSEQRMMVADAQFKGMQVPGAKYDGGTKLFEDDF